MDDIKLKTEVDGFVVEYELLPQKDFFQEIKDDKAIIISQINEIDELIEDNQSILDEYNREIYKMENHADNLDYAVAVASGLLTGIFDIVFVGEFDLKSAKAKTHEKINKSIIKYAKKKGYKGDRLDGAITFLEKKFPVAQDNAYFGKGIGVHTTDHHLADLAHHPTLIGLLAAIIVELLDVGIFVNKDGEWHFQKLDTDPKEIIKRWIPIVISGLLNWIINIAEAHYEDKMDEEIPKPIHYIVKALADVPLALEILKVARNWKGHLYSDMGGSHHSAGDGAGIPGVLLSLLKEISSLPLLKDTKLPQLVNDLYKKKKFDMRTEVAVLSELKRQAIPVLINEVLVRSFYFIRHLVKEIKENNNDLKAVKWENVIPFDNRTIVRMMTISSGTFTAVDLGDAAIRAASNPTSASVPTFLANMVLRVNFVGVARFAIAAGTDIYLGVKREKLRNERLYLYSNQLYLRSAKLFYMHGCMWIEAEGTEKSIKEMEDYMMVAVEFYSDSILDMKDKMKVIGETFSGIKESNPVLANELLDLLDY